MQATIHKKHFQNRYEAGAILAERLSMYSGRRDVIVLALPRGGVPVGFSIARKLHVPLDFLLVQKLGVPGHDEYAMGAISSDGLCILRHGVIKQLNIPQSAIDAVIARKKKELAWRTKLYRSHRSPIDLEGCTLILVDDGLASGATMLAAVQLARAAAPSRIIVAIPVATPDSVQLIQPKLDHLHSVGFWYEDFRQIDDDEVIQLLNEASNLKKLDIPN